MTPREELELRRRIAGGSISPREELEALRALASSSAPATTEQALGPSGPGVTADVFASIGALGSGAKHGTGNVLRGLAELGLTDTEQMAVKSQGGFQNFPAPGYAATKAKHPYATGFGESAPYLAAGIGASMIPGAQGFAPGIATQAAAGGLVGAAMPGSGRERAERAGLDALVGGAGGAVAGGLGVLAQRAMRPEVNMMREAGVVPTVGQTLGGYASRAEEKLASLPLVGDFIQHARQRARNEFNVGGINRALAPTGETVAEAGHPGIGAAQQAVSRAYDAAENLAPGGIRLEPTARADIAQLRLGLRGAPEPDQRAFERFYSQIFQRKLGGAAGFEVNNFRELDQLVGKEIREAGSEKLKSAFMEFQDILRKQAEAANPAYAAADLTARETAARLMRVEHAANAAALQGGVFTPGQLVRGAKAMDTTSRRRASSSGNALMQDYATAGQSVLGDIVPDSGSPARLWLTAGATGGLGGAAGAGVLDPTYLAALAALAGGSTRAAQRGMNAAIRGGRYAPPWLGQPFQGQ